MLGGGGEVGVCAGEGVADGEPASTERWGDELE